MNNGTRFPLSKADPGPSRPSKKSSNTYNRSHGPLRSKLKYQPIRTGLNNLYNSRHRLVHLPFIWSPNPNHPQHRRGSVCSLTCPLPGVRPEIGVKESLCTQWTNRLYERLSNGQGVPLEGHGCGWVSLSRFLQRPKDSEHFHLKKPEV